MNRLRLLPLAVAVLLLAVASVLPSSAMSTLRASLPWFSHSLSRIERIFDGVDSTHVVMFAGIGLVLAWSLPRTRGWVMAGTGLAVLAVLAGISELVQYAVPGRTPRLSDFGADIVGGGAGLLVGLVLRWLVVACLSAWRGRIRRNPT